MIKNDFLEKYRSPKKPQSSSSLYRSPSYQSSQSLHLQDDNHFFYLEKPISPKVIPKLSSGVLQSFTEDLMVSDKVNELLFPGSSKKELHYYLTQKRVLLKSTKVKREKLNLFGEKELRPAEAMFFKKKRDLMLQTIKDNISNFKESKKIELERLKAKNKEFHKHQTNTEKDSIKLFFNTINNLRKNSYQKAFNYCIKRSMSEPGFNFPDVKLKMNNVFSRLYHNRILIPTKLKKNIEISNNNNEEGIFINIEDNRNNVKFMEINENNNNIKSVETKELNGNETNITNMSKNNNQNLNLNFSDNELNYTNIKKGPKVKSFITLTNQFTKKINSPSILNNSNKVKFNLKHFFKEFDGKEFLLRPTFLVKHKCWSTSSGGPKKKIKTKGKTVYVYKEDKDFSKIRKKILSQENKGKKEIFNPKNYKGENNNSNLHIAVLTNKIQFVKYFLYKGMDINSKNILGETSLHLACKQGNKNIIKLLIKNGGDIFALDKKGNRPLDFMSKEIKDELKYEKILEKNL